MLYDDSPLTAVNYPELSSKVWVGSATHGCYLALLVDAERFGDWKITSPSDVLLATQTALESSMTASDATHAAKVCCQRIQLLCCSCIASS